MQIEVEESPNGPASEQFVFKELGTRRRVKAIRAELAGRETVCDVTGVEPGPRWTPASCVKVADSSDGHAFLIYGGGWGLRLKAADDAQRPWDLGDKTQWGEPFKIYGNEDDIIYADV